jgi:hypothetical protein
MIRAEDTSGAMEIGEYNGVKTLAMREDLDGETYVTWLYCYDGNMYEWFTSDDGDFTPESGTAICPAQRFEPSLENGLLTVDMINGKGEPETVRVALRCAQ